MPAVAAADKSGKTNAEMLSKVGNDAARMPKKRAGKTNLVTDIFILLNPLPP